MTESPSLDLASLTITSADDASFTLTVTATSLEAANGDTTSVAATVSVAFSNLAPNFDDENPVYSVIENSEAGVPVGAVSASDPGVSDVLAYRIVNTWDDNGRDAAGAYAIDPATGVVFVANPALLDYETLRSASGRTSMVKS